MIHAFITVWLCRSTPVKLIHDHSPPPPLHPLSSLPCTASNDLHSITPGGRLFTVPVKENSPASTAAFDITARQLSISTSFLWATKGTLHDGRGQIKLTSTGKQDDTLTVDSSNLHAAEILVSASLGAVHLNDQSVLDSTGRGG